MTPIDVDACRENLDGYVARADARSCRDIALVALAEAERLTALLANVEHLCRQYTPEPPPLFRGPGLSEHGVGWNAGTRDLAGAVLMTLRGEPTDDDACCAECKPGDAE